MTVTKLYELVAKVALIAILGGMFCMVLSVLISLGPIGWALAVLFGMFLIDHFKKNQKKEESH